jgi:hypothetical protein
VPRQSQQRSSISHSCDPIFFCWPSLAGAVAWLSVVAAPTSCVLTAIEQVYLSEVAIYTDFKLDESYTPTKISIRVGNTFRDLREVGKCMAGDAQICVFHVLVIVHCQNGAHGTSATVGA